VDYSARLQRSRAEARHHWQMDVSWTIGVLAAGVENVQPLASGVGQSRTAAVEAASDALVMLAADRGRAEYRVSVAGAEMMVIPGLTDDGEIDPSGLRGTLASLTRNYD
jgi:hypothetical protein